MTNLDKIPCLLLGRLRFTFREGRRSRPEQGGRPATSHLVQHPLSRSSLGHFLPVALTIRLHVAHRACSYEHLQKVIQRDNIQNSTLFTLTYCSNWCDENKSNWVSRNAAPRATMRDGYPFPVCLVPGYCSSPRPTFASRDVRFKWENKTVKTSFCLKLT